MVVAVMNASIKVDDITFIHPSFQSSLKHLLGAYFAKFGLQTPRIQRLGGGPCIQTVHT